MQNAQNTNYKNIIFDYLLNSYYYNYSGQKWMSHFDILSALLSVEFYKLYSIDQFICSKDNISNLLDAIDLDELVLTINLLNNIFQAQGTFPSWFEQICKEKLDESIIYYFESAETSEYCDNYNIGEFISGNTKSYWYNGDVEEDIDKSSVVSDLEKKIISDIEEEIQEKLSFLEERFQRLLHTPTDFYINTTDIENAVDSYFRDSYQDSYHTNSSDQSFILEIETIFER